MSCFLYYIDILNGTTAFHFQQSEDVVSILIKQLVAKDGALQSKNEKVLEMQATIYCLTKTEEVNYRTVQELREKQKQLQATIDGQRETEEANNRKLKELREKQQQLQATIDGQRETEEANNRTIQELREKQKQFQATIDGQRDTEEANNRTLKELREKQQQLQATIDDLTKKLEPFKDVSTYQVEAVATINWAEKLLAINLVNFCQILNVYFHTPFRSSGCLCTNIHKLPIYDLYAFNTEL